MTAARHAKDANAEALRLSLALEDIFANALLGVLPTTEQLGTLRSQSRFVQFNTARTMHATAMFPTPDRRAPPAEPIGDIPTPLAALEVLISEAELTLDYRPSFRAAISNAHTAAINAKKPRVVLQDSIVLGERIEVGNDDLTFGDLFGEPDPSAFNPKVLATARGMAQPREVAHG